MDILSNLDINNFVAVFPRTNSFSQTWAYQAGQVYLFDPMQPGYFTGALDKYNIKSGDKILVNFQNTNLELTINNISLSGTFINTDGVLNVAWDSTRTVSCALDLSVVGGTIFELMPTGIVTQVSASLGAGFSSGTATLTFNVAGGPLPNGVITFTGPKSIFAYAAVPVVCVDHTTASYLNIPGVAQVVCATTISGATSCVASIQYVTPNNYSWI